MVPEIFYMVCYGNKQVSPETATLHTFKPALLDGYCRRRVQNADSPGITEDQDHQVFGILSTGLTDPIMVKLDYFEGRKYHRKTVKVKLLEDAQVVGDVEGDERLAEVYVFNDKSNLEDKEWDLEEFYRDRLQAWTQPGYVQGQKRLLSRVTYKKERQYSGGSTLREAFGKEIVEGDDLATRRTKIEAQIARYGRRANTTWEWVDNDEGIIVTHRLPAIRTQPGTNLPSLFKGLALFYKDATVDNPTSAARKNVTEQLYGDGTPIPERYLKRLVAITDEIRVLHRWEQGDVLVYDNIIAQHGRQPWEGKQTDRVVMASLFDGEDVAGAYGDADWARVFPAVDG